MGSRRLAATGLDALLLLGPWSAYPGLMAHHGVWGGQLGGLGDVVAVAIGALGGDAVILVLEGVLWLSAGRTIGMGLCGVAVVRGRPWVASIVVAALLVVLGGGTTALASAAGSVDPQNAAAAVLLGAKVVDLAFALGRSRRTLVDRLSGVHVGVSPRAPARRVAPGLAIDAMAGLGVGAPALVALTDFDHLAGAALGAGVALLTLAVLQG